MRSRPSGTDAEAKETFARRHRAKVLHAQRDHVVERLRFDNDFPFEPISKHNHRSICKPTSDYLVPVDALMELL